MSFILCLPALDPGWARACVESLDPHLRQRRLLVVDNSARGLPDLGVWRQERPRRNLGVAGSWNRGLVALGETQSDWLVVMSEATVFLDGGLSFFRHLEETELKVFSGLCGWHLVGLRADLLARCGSFDENFYPAYFEDTDYIRRMKLTGDIRSLGHDADTVWSVKDRGEAHSLKRKLVKVEFGPLSDYYRRKWGGNPSVETFRRPFNIGVPVGWWPKSGEEPCVSE